MTIPFLFNEQSGRKARISRVFGGMMDKQESRDPIEPTYKVVSPLGRPIGQSVAYNAPLQGLNGKTVGELWDFLFKGDEMFAIIREQLRRRYPDMKFVKFSEFGNIHGGDEAEVVAQLPNLLREHRCDAVISAVGA